MTRAPPSEQLIALTVADVQRMAELHSAAFPPGQIWGAGQFEDLLNQKTIAPKAMVAGGKILSFVLVQLVADQAEILTLATAPAARRRGLAARLLTGVEAELACRGFETWLLDVAEDNPGALNFYQKNGFRIDGRRRDYYQRLEGQRVDAILMSKPMARQVAT